MFRMIALTSTLGKLYHQIKAERMADFMTKNGYIDEATQKAFIKGVNGCIEHMQVLQEVINDAKQKKRTVHFSWYDLSDAYGSIPHNLIEHCLKHYHIPQREINYIMDLYAKLEGRIVTKEWKSELFKFCRGIFTGDNYSPIIFNVVFQPLIDFIKVRKDKQGYALGNSRVITKPFADDFEIISNNERSHQNLQDKIQLNATSMGLTGSQAVQVSHPLFGERQASTSCLLPHRPHIWGESSAEDLGIRSSQILRLSDDLQQLTTRSSKVLEGQTEHQVGEH